jgi:6-phospho-beta-glucosidase
MSARLAVLGGSSPFTIALFEALVEVAPRLPRLHVSLFGRRLEYAEAIAGYARAKIDDFGWTVAAATGIEDCLTGADLVIHQIRYGGMEARHEDEELCAGFGVRYDETLGLGALNALLRTARQMQPIGEALSRHCKEAWIVNLTNPLSAVTTLLNRQYALPKCLGACELPVHTAEAIARQLGSTLDDLQWAYSGLNHRGFIHNLRLDGQDALPDFLAALPGHFGGIPKQSIEALNAVPLKYFTLLLDDGPVQPTGRANYLNELARKIFAEMRASPGVKPASLGLRETPWYREAVVPLILALSEGSGKNLVASVPNGTRVTQERRIVIDKGRINAAEQPAPPQAVTAFLRPLVAHEDAMVRAALEPSAQNIREAIGLDQLVPKHRTDACAALLIRQWL